MINCKVDPKVCSCECHANPGMRHFMPCCGWGPYQKRPPSKKNQEIFEKMGKKYAKALKGLGDK